MSKFIDVQKLRAIFDEGNVPATTANALRAAKLNNLLEAAAWNRQYEEKEGKPAGSITGGLRSCKGFGHTSLQKLMDHILLEIERLASNAEDQAQSTPKDDVALAVPIVCELIRRMAPEVTIGGHGQTSVCAEIAIDFVQALRRKNADAQETQP